MTRVFGISKMLRVEPADDGRYYFSMGLGNDGTLRGFSGSSDEQGQHLLFSDVMVFDITYKTNK